MSSLDLPALVARLTLEQKVRLLTGADFWALYDEPSVGLRRMVTSDGPAGVRGELWDERDPSTNIPSPTAIAASWDPELTATLVACSPTRRVARASTSCWRPPSTCTARPTAAGTSSA